MSDIPNIRRVYRLPSYLTSVAFSTALGMIPNTPPPLLDGLTTGRAVTVASRLSMMRYRVL